MICKIAMNGFLGRMVAPIVRAVVLLPWARLAHQHVPTIRVLQELPKVLPSAEFRIAGDHGFDSRI